ncbi:MAG: hypothetical protein IJ071_12940 [Ruminococcus sp.]|nr:hypothetical protein [Ruminococcus sp.]
MERGSFMRNIAASLIALIFIPLLFSGVSQTGTANDLSRASCDRKVITCDVYSFVEAVCAEEHLTSKTARLQRCDTSRRLPRLRDLDRSSRGGSFLWSAVGISFAALYSFCRKICRSHRAIIKYIHDQDGHKITPSYY